MSTASAPSLEQRGTTDELLEQLRDLGRAPGEAALDAAQVLLVDFLGVAVAGSAGPEGRAVAAWGKRRGAPGRCHVAGGAETYAPAAAALVTSTSGYSIGLTDTHARSITHPGPSVVPAALAVAEQVGASGRDLLTAVVVGCEAIVRIGSVVNPSHRRRGFHPTSTCNGFGVVAAAAHLMDLDETTTASAFGIAGSMAGGLYEFRHQGSSLMALHGGWPAFSGLTAVDLAHDGFTGPSTVLEGPDGFFRAFADEIDVDHLRCDLDHPGVLEVGLRPYNACRYGHSGIDALGQIEDRHGRVEPADVRRLTVWTHRTAVEQESEPTSVVGARLSTAFTVAHALAHGPKIDEVTEADLVDPLTTDLLTRTEVLEDPALTATFPERWACRVRVETRDGNTYQTQVDVPKGEPDNPMSATDVSAKFDRLVGPVIGADGAATLWARLHEVPHAARVDDLALALTGTAG